MAQKTVLEYVQDTLDAIGGIQVDSIEDTEESILISRYLVACYDEMLGRDIEGWPWLRRPVTLVAAVDPTQPTKFLVPAEIVHLLWIKYDVSDDASGSYRTLRWEEPECFSAVAYNGTGQLRVTEDNGLKFTVRTDVSPTTYTSFDNKSIYLNAVDQSIETTVQGDKLQAYGIFKPTLEVTDTAIPDLPRHMESFLQALLNQEASIKLRKVASPIDDARVNRQIADLSITKDRFQFQEYKGRTYGRRR